MQIEEIPFGYASWYATDKECAKAVHCLRRQVARLYQLQPEPPTTNYCVTPAYVAQVAKGEACREFRSDAPMRYARGMRRLFDHIPKAQYHSVRYDVMNVFSSERAFYYAQKGDQLISPEQQAEITTIFNEYELPAPQFDSYEQRPDWEQWIDITRTFTTCSRRTTPNEWIDTTH